MARSRTADFSLAASGLAVAAFFGIQLGSIPERSFGDPLGSRLVPTIACIFLVILSLIIGLRAALAVRPPRDPP